MSLGRHTYRGNTQEKAGRARSKLYSGVKVNFKKLGKAFLEIEAEEELARKNKVLHNTGMKFKVRSDKYTGDVSIMYGRNVFGTMPKEQYIELAQAVVDHSVGEFKISDPNREAKAKGFGKYHFVKGFLLAWWQDVKKLWGRKWDDRQN